jgi:hypothetical protein
MALLAEEVAPKPEDGLHLYTELPKSSVLGNSEA